MSAKPGFVLRSFTSPDGLALSARDYGGAEGPARCPVVCLHGLTRNARDFEDLAPWIAAAGRRVIVPDMRGRGLSARDPDASHYAIPVYVGDVAGLLDQCGIARAIFIGTSMGGLVAMGMAGLRPGAIAGAVLNDVGPAIEAAGLARIASYAGKRVTIANWKGAAARSREVNEASFPEYGDKDWMKFARRTFREGADGVPEPDYDMAISGMAGPVDKGAEATLWALFGVLVASAPALVVRGGISDLLSEQTLNAMGAAGARTATVPGIGHAPMLDEPAAREAIGAFLHKVP